MTDVLFFLGFLTLPLFGWWTWRLETVRRLDLGARLAVAFAAGALVVALVMAALSLLHIEWSRTALFVILGATAFLGVKGDAAARPSKRYLLAITVFAILTAYGLLTARETAGDLHFFWGPKAIGFYRAGGIDPAYLANKAVNANADYPPMLPLLLAWSHTVAKDFSWWAAVLATLLFLVASVAIVRGFSGDDDGAVLTMATLAFAFAVGFAGGGADPPLVLFETLALAALLFVDNRRDADILAAIGLAGAAWTKIEGATFVIAVVIALVLVERSLKRALKIATPAAILLLGWLAFLVVNELVFAYGGAKMTIYFSAIPQTLKLMAEYGLYESYGLPWVLPLVMIAMNRGRRTALPLLVALLTIGAAVFFYIHFYDPSWWVAASAPRVLLTPLMAVLLAAIASRR